MVERNPRRQSRSCLGWLFIIVAVIASMIFLTVSLYRPDDPLPAIEPGSSAGPTFIVQIIRPREGLPLGGLLPPQVFGVDAELTFSSEAIDSRFKLGKEVLVLSSANWELRLEYDNSGNIRPDSRIEFDLIFEEQQRHVRCKPGTPPIGTFQISEIAPNEFSGSFTLELPDCEDAETGESLGWPPKPFMLRGSFDRIPSVDDQE